MKRLFASPDLFVPGASPIRRLRQSPVRHGSMLLEVIVSAGMLGSLLVTINQTLVQLHRQTRFADRQFVARQTLENLLEEYAHRPWSELNGASLDKLTLPEWGRAKLPAARLGGEVAEESDPVPAKRITLRLGWQNAPGVKQKPCVLTTWVYPPLARAP